MEHYKEIKKNLEDIFDILYEQNKIVLAAFIQEMYFHIDEQDDDYESESESDEDEYYENVSEGEFQIDEEGFYSLL